MRVKENNRLKDKFISQIQGRIFSGEYKPGDRLPPERTLAEEMGISRSCVNQGILDMERAGLLRIVPRKGTFVADYIRKATPLTLAAVMNYDSSAFEPKLFRDLMDMRILVERECVRLACTNINIAGVQLLSDYTDRIYTAEHHEIAEALYNYHLCLVQLSDNAAYSMVFQSFEKALKNLMQAHYENAAEIKKCMPLYNRLTVAVSTGDVKAADEHISNILGLASKALDSFLSQRYKG